MSRSHHRPLQVDHDFFEAQAGGPDPAVLRAAADRAATALVRTDATDTELADRVVHLADTQGLDDLAELWAASPADSLAGSLWRLYLLRTYVHRSPARAARAFAAGRHAAPVADAVAGVPDPPSPDELAQLTDAVLAGVVAGEYADVLFRAAAFVRVVATGAAHLDDEPAVQGLRLLHMAEQLEAAGHLELAGNLH